MLDRFLQQATLQVLQPIFDPTLSEDSYGFRPGRRAHDAVCQAQRYVQSGRRWVVDVDLEKFFDRLNHDVLVAWLAKRIEDKRLLRIIRRYLEAGMMADGVVVERHEGTPQRALTGLTGIEEGAAAADEAHQVEVPSTLGATQRGRFANWTQATPCFRPGGGLAHAPSASYPFP